MNVCIWEDRLDSAGTGKKRVPLNADDAADRLSAQAEETRDWQLRSRLLAAACDVLDHALEHHRRPPLPRTDSPNVSSSRGF